MPLSVHLTPPHSTATHLALVYDGLVAPEALQELVDVVHQLGGRGPALVLGVALQQDDHHRGDVINPCG
jgi:hypothetical protein